MREEVAGDRLIRAVLEFDAGEIGVILDGHAAVDGGDAVHEHVGGQLVFRGVLRQVILVANVADELLGHVFKRDNAVGAAVFINHHSQMNAAFAQQRQAR